MSDSSTWTIGRLLEWTTDYLKQHGSSSPRLDAEVLLAHAHGCERIELYTAFKDEADDVLRQEFRELVKRRAEGSPVAYLVGVREFYSMEFQVNSDVLIPRPETEFVLLQLFDLVKDSNRSESPLNIADVGTGSGNLACCIAKHLPNATVLAIDIQEAALQVARQNADQHQVADRIQFIRSDLFAEVDATQKFDYIVSNPPYIGEGERSTLPNDVVDQEPESALFAGPTGLEILEQLLQQSAERLHSGGWLISELSPIIAAGAKEMAQSGGAYTDVSLVDDLAKLPRVLRVRKA